MRTRSRRPHARARVAGALFAASISGASARVLASEPCHVVEQLDRDDLIPAWRAAIEGLRRELATSLPATCLGIELTLTADEGGVRVSAMARDARRTSRLVLAPAGLSAVAFGLLAMAPSEPEPPPVDPHDYPPPAPPSIPRAARTAPFEQALMVSVSASVGARSGFPTDVVMADTAVRADLVVHDWIVDVNMRVAPIATSPRLPVDSDAYAEAAGGLAFGRELRWGRAALALTGGPNLTYIWMENDAKSASAEHGQLRLAAAARLGYSVARRVRANLTLDGELAPTGFGAAFPVGLAPFPAFTVGLRVGAEVAL